MKILSPFEAGARLAECRKSVGMTRSVLAEASGVSVRTLQSYEQGARALSGASGDTLIRIAKAVDCTIEDLIVDNA